MNTVDNLIQQRRTVKPEKFAETRVEDYLVEQMLENANWAPTHGFTEPWRFWVFKDHGRSKLADFHANLYKKETPTDDFKSKTYQKLYDRPLKASHIIGIAMKRGENPKIPEIEEIEATACAVQNMMLTAAFHGIGTYWNSGGMTYHSKMKAFFDLEESDQVLGFLFVGYPSNEWPKGKRISEINDKTHWIDTND